ncbi:hypothetical protein STSP2_01189 [Anaerohalosphaera lusitana]|uniref:DUF4435 domain-containing protein n=1 Tax=Anaerohalosphaera lusitana TaxID=1936003 RepID=A0A1U9NJP6_9BACT|nr:DUF4435 domain-containing protein [Anaerohalosphaera lusitana]AQT68035.1 hypothetical protein STSP2_01189 [Anaerohalosphaera lusitana]
MVYRRTKSGEENTYLFYGTEITVYVEGGPETKYQDASESEFYSYGDDIRFWEGLFDHFAPGVKCHCKAIGSKVAVREIAEDIAAGDRKRVIAAMDRDFDDLTSQLINSHNVLYTYGYSWENDCCNPSSLVEAYRSYASAANRLADATKKDILKVLQACQKLLARAVRADAVLRLNSHSFFDRDRPCRYIGKGAGDYPTIRVSEIRKRFKEVRREHLRPVRSSQKLELITFRDCFGHLIGHFYCRLLSVLLKKVNKPSIPNDFAFAMIVEKFLVNIANDEHKDIYNHYKKQFRKIAI